jgi:hypothetical protein
VRAVQYLPYWLTFGACLMGLIGAIVTGEWLILLFIPPVAIPYLLFDRSFRKRETADEQLAAEAPTRDEDVERRAQRVE